MFEGAANATDPVGKRFFPVALKTGLSALGEGAKALKEGTKVVHAAKKVSEAGKAVGKGFGHVKENLLKGVKSGLTRIKSMK